LDQGEQPGEIATVFIRAGLAGFGNAGLDDDRADE